MSEARGIAPLVCGVLPIGLDRLCRTLAILFALLTNMALGNAALAADIKTFVDRDVISVDESFQLVFESEGTANTEPDFSALEKNFEILSRSNSSNITIINGKTNRQVRWLLTLIAKRAGELTIPSIAFGRDRSQPARISVKSAAQAPPDRAGDDIFMEVEVDSREVYVQAQFVYTLRLFRAVDVASASLTEPKLDDAEAIVEKLSDDANYQTRRNNRRYLVTERRYALFPQQAGKFSIDPVIFQGEVLTRAPSQFGLFGQTRETKRVRSQALEIEVRDVPEGIARGQWLPAANLTLSDAWPTDPPQFRTGEPVTRTLRLVADGLTAAQLPPLPFQTPKGFKLYPDRPNLDDAQRRDGITGLREEKIALVPTQPGSYTLPEIAIPWWNTRTQHQQITRLPARTIEVIGATGQPNETTSRDAAPAPALKVVPIVELPNDSNKPNWWPWIALILGIGWMATTTAWWLNRRRAQSVSDDRIEGHSLARKAAVRKLRTACAANDKQATKDALLAWAASRWPDSPPTNLGDTAQRCNQPLSVAIGTLEHALYGPQSLAWSGTKLWDAFDSGNRKFNIKDAKAPLSELEPLYPA